MELDFGNLDEFAVSRQREKQKSNKKESGECIMKLGTSWTQEYAYSVKNRNHSVTSYAGGTINWHVFVGDIGIVNRTPKSIQATFTF